MEIHHLNTESVLSLTNIFKLILKQEAEKGTQQLADRLVFKLGTIQAAQILTIVLNELSIYLRKEEQIYRAL